MNGSALFLGISLFFGFATLITGFVVGIWFAAPSNRKPADASPADASDSSIAVAAQQVRQVSSSLFRVVHDLANDVTAHSTKIEAISSELRAADQSLQETRTLMGFAPERILAANFELQEQLAKAKRQIELQAAQLRSRESEARTDSLTALSNRRAFEEEMSRQLSLWDRNQIPFALLLLDIDHFKALNDLHGHLVGDEVLQEVARVIVGQLRGMDIAYRHGGEEFAVLLPMTNAGDAGIVAERIRAAVEQTVISSGDKRLTVATSVGVAHVIAPDEAAKMVRRADEALYKAKQSGRNCVRWHNGKEIVSLDSGNNLVAKTCPTPQDGQTSIVMSLTALNRELTKQVCSSRRSDTPLTVVCVRVDVDRSTDGAIETTTGDLLLLELVNLLQRRLCVTDFVVPMNAAELVVVTPERSRAAAIQLIAEIIGSNEAIELSRSHGALPQFEACELLPNETAEQLLTRTRESVLAASGT